MRTVFLKELREHGKWAALLCGIMIVWTYIRLVMHENNALIQVSEVLNIMAPLAALALGVAQTVFDIKPDNWAFTVHRPLRRGEIFTAKVMAGLAPLYACTPLPIAPFAASAAHPRTAAMSASPRP